DPRPADPRRDRLRITHSTFRNRTSNSNYGCSLLDAYYLADSALPGLQKHDRKPSTHNPEIQRSSHRAYCAHTQYLHLISTPKRPASVAGLFSRIYAT